MHCNPIRSNMLRSKLWFKSIAFDVVQIYCIRRGLDRLRSTLLHLTPFKLFHCIQRCSNFFIVLEVIQMIPLHLFKLCNIIRRFSYYSIPFEAVQIFKLHSIPFILSHYIRSRSKPFVSIPFKSPTAFEGVQIISVNACESFQNLSLHFEVVQIIPSHSTRFKSISALGAPVDSKPFKLFCCIRSVQIIQLHSKPYKLFYCIQIISKSYFTFEAIKSHFIWWCSNPVLSSPLKSIAFNACQIDWIGCRSNYHMSSETIQIIPYLTKQFKLSDCIRRLANYHFAFDAFLFIP